ncbi:MAG: radical SAM protein [Candidatus Coatesbacteria bacterium]|nr:radical SAM protein [Candidatus Coatesbacteria bacterium]
MKILLVQSFTSPEEPPIYPLGLACLKTVLKENHEIYGLDINVSTEDEYLNMLDKYKYDVIGFGIRNIKVATIRKHANIVDEHHNLIRIAKRVQPDSVLIAGGMGFSLFAEPLMRIYNEIDYGLFGSAEVTFPKLLQNLYKPQKVAGVYYRFNQTIKYSFNQTDDEKNKLVTPDRTIIPVELYARFENAYGIQTRRGCILNCIHCSDKHLLGSNIFTRPVEDIVNELKDMEKIGIKNVFFADQIFNIPYEYTKSLLKSIIENEIGIKWTAWFYEKNLDMDFFNLMKESGCKQAIFSPDSADNKILNNLRKEITSKDLKKTYMLAKKANLRVGYDFMLNAPGETIFSLVKTISFIIKAKLHLGKLLALHGLFIVTMRIYPNTELQKISIEKEIIDKDDDLLEPKFYNPFPLSVFVNLILKIMELLWLIKKLFKK